MFNFKGVRSIIVIVVCVLLFINVYRFMALGGTNYNDYYYYSRISFGSLLDAFHNTNFTIDTSWLRSFQTWGASLTSIPLIGDGLAFLVNIVSIAIWTATALIQVAIMITTMFTALLI